MPTFIITHKAGFEIQEAAERLAAALPGIAAPLVNVEGSAVHEGGVGFEEVIVYVEEHTGHSVNAPDLRLAGEAHKFPARVDREQFIAAKIHDEARTFLDHSGGKQLSLASQFELTSMGYKSSDPKHP